MKALVLAAGTGERLKPLTNDCPKPMMVVGDEPILAKNIALLCKAGITDIAINVHHLPDVITSFFGNGDGFGVRIRYSYEPSLWGTAGAAKQLESWLVEHEKDFVVVYGDNLSTIDLSVLIALHHARNADFTMALFQRDDVQNSGVALLGADDRILSFVEKPKANSPSGWVNAGYYVAKASVLDAIPAGAVSDFGRDIVPALIGDGARIFGYPMTERLWWIDSEKDYERTLREYEGLP